MTIAQDALADFVLKVNAAVALVSWPYILYESLAKHPHIPDLNEKLALRRSQILGEVAFDLAERIRPYLPRTTGRIIIEADVEDEDSPRLNDDAMDEIKACLESREHSISIAVRIRGCASRMLRTDSVCYWLIFATALESFAGLAVWFFDSTMSGWIAKILIGVPILTILLGLACAGVLRTFMHTARRMINPSERD